MTTEPGSELESKPEASAAPTETAPPPEESQPSAIEQFPPAAAHSTPLRKEQVMHSGFPPLVHSFI